MTCWCMELASAVEPQWWASSRWRAASSRIVAPSPPSSAGTPAPGARRRAGVVASATKVPSGSWRVGVRGEIGPDRGRARSAGRARWSVSWSVYGGHGASVRRSSRPTPSPRSRPGWYRFGTTPCRRRRRDHASHGRLRAVLPCRDGQRGPRRPVDAAHRAGAGARQHPVQRHRPRAARASPARCSCSGCAISSARACVETWPSPTGHGNEYHLTPAGQGPRAGDRQPRPVGDRVAVRRPASRTRSSPTTLMWWMHRRIDPERLPPRRVVIEWRHTAPEPETIWFVLDRGDGLGVHAASGLRPRPRVPMATADLADVFQGYRRWQEAVESGAIAGGSVRPGWPRPCPRWFVWSPWVGGHPRSCAPPADV